MLFLSLGSVANIMVLPCASCEASQVDITVHLEEANLIFAGLSTVFMRVALTYSSTVTWMLAHHSTLSWMPYNLIMMHLDVQQLARVLHLDKQHLS